jgi:hypothetical protein
MVQEKLYNSLIDFDQDSRYEFISPAWVFVRFTLGYSAVLYCTVLYIPFGLGAAFGANSQGSYE